MDSERKTRPRPRAGASTVPSSEGVAGDPTVSPAWATTAYGEPVATAVNSKESAADALAAAALRDRPVIGADRTLQATRASSELEAGATPLPDGVRADLEARFGYDLSEVLVRISDPAVAERGSRAMAVGRVIAFAPGAWDPRSTKGRELIAHELAHVVLSQGQPASMASQKTPVSVSFYQGVIDAFNSSWGLHELAIKPILLLCQTVEAENVTDVKKRIDDLAGIRLALLPPLLPSTGTATELMARLMLLGLPGEAIRYRNWHVKLQTVSSGVKTGARYFDEEAWLLQQALAVLRTKIDWTSDASCLKLLDAELRLIPELLKERDGLDPQAVKDDLDERSKAPYRAGAPLDTDFGNQSSRPTMTISRYQHALNVLLRSAFVDAQAPIQGLIDLATADLTAGLGTKKLDELDKRVVALGALTRQLPAMDLEINETVYETKGRKDVLIEVDSFLDQPGAKLRSTQLDSYDVEDDINQTYPRPHQEVSPARMVTIRMRQIAALRRIYGVEEKGGKLTPEAVENAAALKGQGKDGLRLHNDDDWRKLLLAKYKGHLASSNAAEAMNSLIELLRVYLRAFTTHSPMNIDDFGDNLLTQSFPRALTGQLVHDCGVYAMRIAYMLSLVREDPSLKLEFRFVQLPVHIGLVITSKTAPIGAWLIHNDMFINVDETELAITRKRWDAVDEKGNPRATPAPHTKKTDDAFLGELATDAFIPMTDAPYRISEVPHLSGSGTTDKATMWAAYQAQLKHKLFSKLTEDPKDPDYQFHLRYLKLLELIKKHHNDWLVPFWNLLAHPAWKATKDELIAANTKLLASAPGAPAETTAKAELDKAVKRYLDSDVAKVGAKLEEAFLKVKRNYLDTVDTASVAITNAVEARPGVIGADASRAYSDRLREAFDPYTEPWWGREVGVHIAEIKKGIVTPPPPYAEEKDLLARVD